MPVFAVSENTSPQLGFSRKRSMLPSGRVITIANSSGFSTRLSAIDASAPASWCALTIAPRSMSVSTSPEITRNVSSSSSDALRTEPAVPSGDSSVA